MKYLALLIIGVLLLVSCTTQNVKTETTEHVNTDVEVVKAEESEPAQVKDADISIINGKLDPEELALPLNKETTLTIHNTMDGTMRFDIPLYGSQVSEDIGSGEYVIVKVFPKNKGFVSMELNGAPVGTISIQ